MIGRYRCYRRDMLNDPEYTAWLATVPPEFTQDTIWRMSAYRFSMFLMTKSQDDVAFVIRCRETRTLADQLLDAVGGSVRISRTATAVRAAVSVRISTSIR